MRLSGGVLSVLLAVPLTVSHAAGQAAQDDVQLDLIWGGQGQGDGQFRSPYGNTMGADGLIYVADAANHRIQVFQPDGTFVRKWGGKGSGDGQFNDPFGIAGSKDNLIYVADASNHRIQVFQPDGAFVRTWGGKGSGDSQFNLPRDLAVGADGLIVVADTDNHRIQVFQPDGTLVRKWGSPGSGNGQFNFPRGIAVGPDGLIYVTEDGNHRVQVFQPDGTFVRAWGSFGSGDGQFDYPFNLDVGKDGLVYVPDLNNSRIQVFRSDGTFVGKWGRRGPGSGQFIAPYAVGIGNNGLIYVTDSGNHRIQVFRAFDGTAIRPPDATRTERGTWAAREATPAGGSRGTDRNGVAAGSPGNGLVVDFDFASDSDNRLPDRSGMGNHGTLHNVAFGGETGAGRWGNFNGSNSYMCVPHTPSLGSIPFTVTAWVWSDEDNAVADRAVFGKHEEHDNVSYFWLYQHFDQIQATMVGDRRGVFQNLACDMNAWYKKWAFVSVGYDGRFFSLTVNGNMVGVQPVHGFVGNRYDLLIGAGEFTMGSRLPQRWWKGRIGPVRYYSRALEQEEVAALALQGPVPRAAVTPATASIPDKAPSVPIAPRPPTLGEIRQLLGQLTPKQLNAVFRSVSPAIQLMPGVTRIAFSDGNSPWNDTTVFTVRDTLHVRVEDVALEKAADTGATVKLLATQGGDEASGVEPFECSVALEPVKGGGFKGLLPLNVFIPGKVCVSVIGLSPDGTQLFRVSVITLKP